jgi:hypothetical protein
VENVRLKERIKELEEALMPLPILSIPLAMIGPTTSTEKLKGSTSLLNDPEAMWKRISRKKWN